MSLSTGLNIAKSALAFVSLETSVLSRNIAGASDENYVRRDLNPLTVAGGGVQPSLISRASNGALLRQYVDSTSVSAKQEALVDGLNWLHQTVANPELGQAPTEKLAALESAPESLPLQQAVMTSYERKLDFLRQAAALTAEG